MQTILGQKEVAISPSSFISGSSEVPPSSSQLKRLKTREFISWGVCFGVVTLLTGLMKLLRVGITMEPITSIFFYLSIAGLVYFMSKAIRLSKAAPPAQSPDLARMN